MSMSFRVLKMEDLTEMRPNWVALVPSLLEGPLKGIIGYALIRIRSRVV